jgi:hypothetical protein
LALNFLGKCRFFATWALASLHVFYTFSQSFRPERKKCPTDAQVRRISWDFVGSASLGADRCLLNAAPGWPPTFNKAPQGAFCFGQPPARSVLVRILCFSNRISFLLI